MSSNETSRKATTAEDDELQCWSVPGKHTRVTVSSLANDLAMVVLKETLNGAREKTEDKGHIEEDHCEKRDTFSGKDEEKLSQCRVRKKLFCTPEGKTQSKGGTSCLWDNDKDVEQNKGKEEKGEEELEDMEERLQKLEQD